jgi:hypothetical protein
MKIAITCTPKFWIELSPEHVEVLRKLAIWHYDGVCNRAALQGGFIYGWCNSLSYAAEGEISKCSGSFRDLDLCLKIMESVHQLIDSEISIVREMQKCFRAALIESNSKLSQIEFSLD